MLQSAARRFTFQAQHPFYTTANRRWMLAIARNLAAILGQSITMLLVDKLRHCPNCLTNVISLLG